jgi:uncharacterized protein YceH (UPF0502 family)
MFELSPVEARVLGCLIEKEVNTPEYYPLSLNATLNACNQKSSREPVMELVESDVRTALFELSKIGLVRTDASARVTKFEHRVRDVLNLRRDEVAVLCLLLLRGPQTSAELRGRSERMFSFDDNAAALATLERLAAREEPLVKLLPRQPGAREARWAHLLSGTVEQAAAASSVNDNAGEAVISLVEHEAALRALASKYEHRLGELEVRLDELEARFIELRALEGPQIVN